MWIGLVAMAVGLLLLIWPNAAWPLVWLDLSMKGIEAERTPRWVHRQRILGVVIFVIGCLLAWGGLLVRVLSPQVRTCRRVPGPALAEPEPTAWA